MTHYVIRTVAVCFLILPLLVMSGCGFSAETVEQIRDIDKELFSLRLDIEQDRCFHACLEESRDSFDPCVCWRVCVPNESGPPMCSVAPSAHHAD